MTSAPDDDRDLHAYVDGELDPDRHARVGARLARDPSARGRANAYAAQLGLLRKARQALPNGRGDARTAALADGLAGLLESRRATPRPALLLSAALAAGPSPAGSRAAFRSASGKAVAHERPAVDPTNAASRHRRPFSRRRG